MIKCGNCGKETSNPKFCSRRCAAISTNAVHPKRKIIRLCSKCDQPIANWRVSMCKPHHEEYLSNKKLDCRNRTIGDYRNKTYLSDKHRSWMHAEIRSFARAWLSHLRTRPCLHCGYDKHVELAHIRDISSFPDDTPLSVINSESNVIPLCPNCHWEFDNLPRPDAYRILVPPEGIEPPSEE